MMMDTGEQKQSVVKKSMLITRIFYFVYKYVDNIPKLMFICLDMDAAWQYIEEGIAHFYVEETDANLARLIEKKEKEVAND
jgi:hypothetical protein